MIEFDDESFSDTAVAIWRANPNCRPEYPSAAALERWMRDETVRHAEVDGSQGWGTLGFHISICRGEYAMAGVDGWFARDYMVPRPPQRKGS